MFYIAPLEDGITLYSEEVPSLFFATRLLLLNFIGVGALRYSVGPALRPELGVRYVIRDHNDNLLSAADFEHLWKRPVTRSAIRSRFYFWNGAGPVPRAGRGRGGRLFRRIPTTQERRANVVMEDCEPTPRRSRSGANLASSWDDRIRSDYGLRNWKHFRKNQWKS